MSDKLQAAREYILQKIERGELAGGAKLPAAREYSEEIGVSLPITQMAFNSLTRDGILASVPRQGTYVRRDWNCRILPGSFRTFRPVWTEIIRDQVVPEVPGLRICDAFRESAFEIRSTFDANWRQDDYLDLNEFLEEAYPDRGDFFMTQFQSFHARDGKLYAIPLIFSPWVICCNVRMIEAARGELPRPDWHWQDFLALIGLLRRKYPPKQVFDLWYSPTFRLTFLFRSGGAVLERAADGSCRVRLDEPESIAGLKRLQELSRVLGDSRLHWYDSRSSFRAGTMALAAAAREDVDFNAAFEWISVPLPMLPGGADRTRQANDLLCVRRQVTDFRQVAEVVRLLLSQQVQDRLGAIRYGIPIRRSSAIRSFNEEDRRDAVFFSELPKIVPDHSLGWSELQRLLLTGIDRIRHGQAEPEPVATELAAAFRTIIRYS